MFGIGLPEMILIIGVALLVVGPDRLPELAKTLSRQMIELKRAANSLKDSLNEEDRQGTKPAEQFPQIAELTSESPRALPGDQWVHEPGLKETKLHQQETPSEEDLDTIVAGAAS